MDIVVLAAGLGSRFGGLKQLTPLTPQGEFIIDFSVYDAIKSGFDRIIFLTKREHKEDFEETISKRIRNSKMGKDAEICYAFQDPEPFGFDNPEGRTKPWGTTHAIISCAGAVKSDFAVINSDDYYGAETYPVLYDFLKHGAKDDRGAMVGFLLKNTISENGAVSRGVCKVDGGILRAIDEHTGIERGGDGVITGTSSGGVTHPLDDETVVSMNCWALPKTVIGEFSKQFPVWFRQIKNPLKDEMFLPNSVGGLIETGKLTVEALSSPSVWFGVTYRSDAPSVERYLAEMKEKGVYPENLWA